MVLFLSISGTLYQNIAMKKVAQALVRTSDVEIVDLIAGTHSRAYQSLSENEKAIVIPEVTDAMRSVWFLFVTGATVSFLLSLFLSVSSPLIRPRLINVDQVSRELNWSMLAEQVQREACRFNKRGALNPFHEVRFYIREQ